MNVILSSVTWKFAIVYVDDILFFLKFVVDNIGKRQCELPLLFRAGITLKLKIVDSLLRRYTTCATIFCLTDSYSRRTHVFHC